MDKRSESQNGDFHNDGQPLYTKVEEALKETFKNLSEILAEIQGAFLKASEQITKIHERLTRIAVLSMSSPNNGQESMVERGLSALQEMQKKVAAEYTEYVKKFTSFGDGTREEHGEKHDRMSPAKDLMEAMWKGPWREICESFCKNAHLMWSQSMSQWTDSISKKK